MADIVRTEPPLPQTERGCTCVLNADSSGDRLIYCNGTNVIWRSLAPLVSGTNPGSPDACFCWRGHIRRTTCAAMSPNGQWVASGDVTGAVRVWGAKGDNVQKNEYQLWDGQVKDVSWSGDNGRLVAAGDGKDTRAAALIWDTGSKTGDVGGHSKIVNSISFRSQRPFRVMTGSEDMTVGFHEGPPFKFSKGHTGHTNFVNCVRFSPDGEWAVSGGADGKLILYQGKSGDVVSEFAKPKDMSGSIWFLAWSPDSAFVATAGGDRMLRIWSRETAAEISSEKVGAGALDDMLLGLCWAASERVATVCLDGRLLIWKVAAGDCKITLETAVEGTQGSLTCVSFEATSGTLFQGGSDGTVAMTPASGPVRSRKVGKGVTHIITRAGSPADDAGPEAWVISLDETVRRLSVETGSDAGSPISLGECAISAGWLDSEESKLLVVTRKRNLHCVSSTAVEWTKESATEREPTALATLPGSVIAIALDRPDETVGGIPSQKFDIHLFAVADNLSPEGLVPTCVLEGHVARVCSMSFSPSGEFLASADANNKILVWNMKADPPTVVSSDFSRHTARVAALSWFPDGKRFLSGSLDQRVSIHNVGAPAEKKHVDQLHKGGVTGLVACSNDTFASVGADGFLLVSRVK
eukprot:TRINITY_DN6928_c0_g1_i1.p1 TRINITY_DN6928_c0_g1~~TRINITY_DN6928_c0_g1_i1.p1  ORF type:complete len:638 (+),score=81.77 TRINITY_DN6928_c0_g1_i1:79-1992(+)